MYGEERENLLGFVIISLLLHALLLLFFPYLAWPGLGPTLAEGNVVRVVPVAIPEPSPPAPASPPSAPRPSSRSRSPPS